MLTYYCEVTHINEPHFPGHKIEASGDEKAIETFKKMWDDKLLCVYTEDFVIIYIRVEGE